MILKCSSLLRVACEASVPVRAKCYVSRESEDSGRAKIGARAKKGKEGEGWRIFTRTRHIALRSHGNACYAGYATGV